MKEKTAKKPEPYTYQMHIIVLRILRTLLDRRKVVLTVIYDILIAFFETYKRGNSYLTRIILFVHTHVTN